MGYIPYVSFLLLGKKYLGRTLCSLLGRGHVCLAARLLYQWSVLVPNVYFPDVRDR